MALPDHLSALLDPRSYPHPCPHIELIETHISWVILTGDYAYKLKKPVRFNFVDFSTLALRLHFCREELRCNRAFAPQLYVSLVAIRRGERGLEAVAESTSETADQADVVEWAVQMRQFDPELALDRLLERGELGEDALDDFGRDLADRHAALPVLEAGPADVPKRVFGPVEDNFEEIGNTGLADRHRRDVDATLARSRAVGDSLRPAFDARLIGGCVRECHGDLHLSNLARIDGVVTAFDCLEFNENLRWIDTMSDVAFLFMDCHFRGRTALAYRFLDSYLEGSGDYNGAQLLHYFAAYRSVVRAKVAALRWVQEADEATAERFARHLVWARDRLTRPRGRLVLTCGLSGSGKSYLATRLLARLPAVRLRSDVARKHLAGIGTLARSDSGIDSGLYDPAQSDRTFAHLAAAAEGLLVAGEHVIVDATFIERSRRAQFLELAERLGVVAVIVHCRAPDAVLTARLEDRARAGADPSEATVEVLRMQQERFEPPGDDEPCIRVDTDRTLTDDFVGELSRRITGLQ
ncbi:MAG: AAA family ATPase [Pseudomonadales bacterium]|jgi:aminoglycoside phosphotransferase family enzyme/predicted kinase